ncbi:hypothetical protein A33Q_0337 [Indibacter alkaliphilus LW1]|uniref:Uncharacterized protein n=1 Tax=Indibacter alkaliphilus (strain CCUG 57479 / KCTC 22604 / LW1) TaxID=1189612 RepID=S2E4Z8_INDAL|nr:hypothetical protein A33Q_0337 [Indibacter alkaliphilus LW1]
MIFDQLMTKALEDDGYLLLIQNKSFLHGFALNANINIIEEVGSKLDIPSKIQ